MNKVFFKAIQLSILGIGLGILSKAQYTNHVWIVGLDPYQWKFGSSGIVNSVYLNPPITSKKSFGVAHSNIQDSSGLLFSCNGFYLYDKYGGLIDTQAILPNNLVNYLDGGSRLVQQTIILPKGDNTFYVFAWGMSDSNFDIAQISGWYTYDILTYSIVNLNENGGNGKVTSRLNYLIQGDTLSICQMSAVKHANGRDWWLIKPHYSRHLFNVFLVNADSVYKQPLQEFDSPVFTNGVNGQSNFSPDGSLYAMTSTFSSEYIQVNRFDRCTGQMTKFKSIPRKFDTLYNDYIKISGVAFSPNGRFLYLVNNVSIVQYDLETDERIELITDSIYNPAGYTTAYNAPDGRIYLGNYDGTQSAMSYIAYPNKRGVDAGLCQLCFHTQNNNALSPPNMPNYELGALKGSSCDTIGKLQSERIVIYPNPVSSSVYVFIPLPMNTKLKASLYDMLGQRIATWNEILNSKQEAELKLNHVAIGMYTLRIEAGGERYVSKLVVE